MENILSGAANKECCLVSKDWEYCWWSVCKPEVIWAAQGNKLLTIEELDQWNWNLFRRRNTKKALVLWRGAWGHHKKLAKEESREMWKRKEQGLNEFILGGVRNWITNEIELFGRFGI
jgi:hypothetical protein